MSLLQELLAIAARRVAEGMHPGPGALANDKFCDEVDELVEKEYHMQDGGDLCWNLIEQDVIDIQKHSVKEAAAMVAQRIGQA